MQHKIVTWLKHPPIPWSLVILVSMLVLWLLWLFVLRPHDWYATPQDEGVPARPALKDASTVSSPQGPPWIYGKPDARFTLVEYADLECPYCQAYFPVLREWINANPEVNWQWHHLPLTGHEPAATREARIAECAGELGGQGAFWEALGWIYAYTAGNGEGIPGNLPSPDLTAPLQECLDSQRPDTIIQTQAQEAAQENITATPTLRLIDHKSGKSLVLHGPVDGDALLSAVDWLATPVTNNAAYPTTHEKAPE